jgi:hypothetical protein
MAACGSLRSFALVVVAGRGQWVPGSAHVPRPSLLRSLGLLLYFAAPGTHCPRRPTLAAREQLARQHWWWPRALGGRRSEVKEEPQAAQQTAAGERAWTQTVQWTVCAWRAPGTQVPGMNAVGHPTALAAAQTSKRTTAKGRLHPTVRTAGLPQSSQHRPSPPQAEPAGQGHIAGRKSAVAVASTTRHAARQCQTGRNKMRAPAAEGCRDSQVTRRPEAQFCPSAFSSAAVKSLLSGAVMLP